jgi:hypothetical protein
LFSKKGKLCVTSCRGFETTTSSTQMWNFIFLISSFYPVIWFCKKKQKMPQDAAWNAVQSISWSLFHLCKFCFQKKQNSMRSIFKVAKIDRTEFCFFWKQNVHNSNKLCDVDCRAFTLHLVVYFVSSYEIILDTKKMK